MREYLRYMALPLYAPDGVSGAAAGEQQNSDNLVADKDAPQGDGESNALDPNKTKDAEASDGDDGESTEKDTQDEEASEAGRKLSQRKRTMQDRLDQVTGKFRDAERRAKRAEKALADHRAKMQQGYSPDDNPDLNYSLDRRKVDDLKSQLEEANSEKTEARMDAWKERASAFKETHDDFEKVAYSAPIGDETSELISDMDDGPAVAYHLGKNPAEARRIDRLSASQKAFALGRIAERVTQKPLQRRTEAPKPINGGVSGSGKSGVKPKFDAMSNADYAAIVAAEEKAKQR